MLKRTLGFGAFAALAMLASAASAQTKLNWAHVYEVTEPFHTESVWAAEEIGKRTDGRYEIAVFPASQLGKEADINQGLKLGTVDIIISGSSFAAREYPPIGVTYYPYIFRDSGAPARLHQERRLQAAGRRLRGGLGQPHHRGHLLRHPPDHGEQGDHQVLRPRGREDARARRAGLPRHAAVLRRQHRADRLRRGLSRAAERHGRGAGEPADHDRGEEVLRGADQHRADRAHRRPPQHRRLADRAGPRCRTRTRRSSPR